MRGRLAQIAELIATAIAEDLGAGDNDVRPQVVAASLTAAFDVLFEQGAGPSAKPKTAEEVAALVDPIITFLRGASKHSRRRAEPGNRFRHLNSEDDPALADAGSLPRVAARAL